MKMAWAENAVIIKDDGNRVEYHIRCPQCGWVNERQTGTVVVGSGVTSAGGGTCRKCGKSISCRFGRN